MSDLAPELETLEHRLMRAWARRDLPVLKSLTASNFQLVIGSTPAVMLDRPSWLESAGSRFHCSAYRFGTIYVRKVGDLAVFASQVELEATLDRADWSGKFWITDLWQERWFRRGYKIAQRMMSQVDESPDVPAAIRSMQLWR